MVWYGRLRACAAVGLVAAAMAGAPGLAVAEKAKMATPSALEQAALWTAGRDGYHTYRIPSLIATKAGALLAFCEGRKAGRGDAGNIDLLVKRSTDGGKTWSAQQVVWDDGDNTCGNPCPVVDAATGTIWLPMTWNRGADRESEITAGKAQDTRRVFLTSSADDGLTWAKPREITADVKPTEWGWYATGPGVGIQLQRGAHKGRLVVPCDHSNLAYKDHRFGSHAIFSDDGGRTWRLGAAIRPAVNECQVVELTDGTLMMNMRSYSGKNCRATALSRDGGATWSAISHATDLPEPVCQASFLRYSAADAGGDRNRLLFANPASAKARAAMTVRLSYDEGKTWSAGKLLHEGPAAYCCLAALPGGAIACLYEAGQKSPYETITLARFPLAWLTEGGK